VAKITATAYLHRLGHPRRQGQKGLRSKRKLAAARRNLKKARQARQLNWLRHGVEVAYATIKPYRQQELAESKAAFAASMAELAVLEPLIRQNPYLSDMLGDLKRRQAQAEDRGLANGDFHQPQPGISVLSPK
jgi:hypothetical protein